MGWWEKRRARRAAEKARRDAVERYQMYVDQMPAGMPLICGKVVGVDVPQPDVRKHIEHDCALCGALRWK